MLDVGESCVLVKPCLCGSGGNEEATAMRMARSLLKVCATVGWDARDCGVKCGYALVFPPVLRYTSCVPDHCKRKARKGAFEESPGMTGHPAGEIPGAGRATAPYQTVQQRADYRRLTRFYPQAVKEISEKIPSIGGDSVRVSFSGQVQVKG